MKLMRLATLVLVLTALTSQADSAGAFEQPLVQTQTSAPPDLQALERKMNEIHINSERFSVSLNLDVELGNGNAFPFVIGGSGVASESPSEGMFTIGLPGAEQEDRLIGNNLYRDEPSIAQYDGGRPWVRSTQRSLNDTLGVSPIASGSEPGSTSGSGSSFSKLLELVGHGESYLEVGPTIVEGEAAQEFQITLDPSRLDGELQKKLSESKKLHVTSLKLDLFISPDGLAVRTMMVIGGGPQTMTMTIDILATEVPVLVQAPPAREVIDEARLRRLQSERKRCLASSRRKHAPKRRLSAVCRGLGSGSKPIEPAKGHR